MSGTLYLIPNTLDFAVSSGTEACEVHDVLPLGVIRTSSRLAYWVAENAKTTRAFLKRIEAIEPLTQPLQSIQIVELPRPQKGARDLAPAPLDDLLKPALEGDDMGLISEAGLPAVADPGAALVQAAHRLHIRVTPLSGPNSLMLALAASGLNGQSFAFVGYLPVDSAHRASRIRELEALSRRWGQTQLIIETPYRNAALLEGLVATLSPQTRLSVSCGLTLPQGWTRTDPVAAWKTSPPAMPANIPAVFSLLAA